MRLKNGQKSRKPKLGKGYNLKHFVTPTGYELTHNGLNGICTDVHC